MPILHIAINIIGDAEIFPIVPYDMIMKAGLPSEFYLFLFGIMRHGIFKPRNDMRNPAARARRDATL